MIFAFLFSEAPVVFNESEIHNRAMRIITQNTAPSATDKPSRTDLFREPMGKGMGPAVTGAPLLAAEESPQMARVSPAQQLLFPATPREICAELGLNWWAALKLHEDGWLSFAPEDNLPLDEAQEAELRFVGSLAIAGCDRAMLSQLLAGLTRPYAYDVRRLHFDWSTRRWQALPDPRAFPETVFTDWLETLVETGDVRSLAGISELAQDALRRIEPAAPSTSITTSLWTETADREQTQG